VAFLSQLVKKFSGGPHISVGAFGKCPLWADHIYPDINVQGLLSDLKQSLYLEGIRDRAIGSWGKADPSQLIAFGHELFWLIDKRIVAGRLWHSVDGRERDDFPMVIAAECSGVSTPWVLDQVMPVLEQLEGSIKRATHRDTIPMLVAETGDLLQQRAVETGGKDAGSEDQTPAEAMRFLWECAELGADREGLMRVMHVLRDMPSRSMSGAPSESVRVPLCAPNARRAIALWERALEVRFGHPPAAVFMAPFNTHWMDISVGKLDPAHFISLRASPQMIPLTTEIGYALDTEIQAQVRQMVGV
jgi:hypothetical protein